MGHKTHIIGIAQKAPCPPQSRFAIHLSLRRYISDAISGIAIQLWSTGEKVGQRGFHHTLFGICLNHRLRIVVENTHMVKGQIPLRRSADNSTRKGRGVCE